MCERGLAAIYSMQDMPGVHDFGRKNWEKAALGSLLQWAQEDGVLEPDVVGQASVGLRPAQGPNPPEATNGTRHSLAPGV